MKHVLSAVACCLAFHGSAPDEESQNFQAQVKTLVRGLEMHHAPLPAATVAELRPLLEKELADTETTQAIQKLLDAQCFLSVSINPESRVKASRGPAVVTLRQKEAKLVFVKITNEAGVTAALHVTGPQLAMPGKGDDDHWLETIVFREAPFKVKLSGQPIEYVVLKLTARETGKREATFRFDVGQGTQDLGFRAEVPILFTIEK